MIHLSDTLIALRFQKWFFKWPWGERWKNNQQCHFWIIKEIHSLDSIWEILDTHSLQAFQFWPFTLFSTYMSQHLSVYFGAEKVCNSLFILLRVTSLSCLPLVEGQNYAGGETVRKLKSLLGTILICPTPASIPGLLIGFCYQCPVVSYFPISYPG